MHNYIDENTFFLARIAQMPFSVLNTFTLEKTLAMREKLLVHKEKRETLLNELSEMIYELIKVSEENDTQKSLLGLKRDLYNNRLSKVIKFSRDSLPMNTQNKVVQFIDLSQLISKQTIQLENMFRNEIISKRVDLKSILSSHEFRKGLQLSNKQLYGRLFKYLEYDNKIEALPKKLRNSEISLLNYLSRMVYKPSPFGAFAGLSHGVFSNLQENRVLIETNSQFSSCRLNISFFEK